MIKYYDITVFTTIPNHQNLKLGVKIIMQAKNIFFKDKFDFLANISGSINLVNNHINPLWHNILE